MSFVPCDRVYIAKGTLIRIFAVTTCCHSGISRCKNWYYFVERTVFSDVAAPKRYTPQSLNISQSKGRKKTYQ